MKRLIVLSVIVVLIIGLVATRDNTNRQKRQTFSNLNQLINPEFFQYIGLVPLSADQTTAARCQALAGQAAPDGCSYVPVIVDSNNLPVNCQVSCPTSTDAIPFQFVGQFSPPIVPDQFTVNDQSNLDVFVGDSYFLFTPSPSTARTAATTSTTTTTTTAATATSMASAVTTTTVATTTALTGDALIRACIDAGQAPDGGCSFNGMGNGTPPALTCAQTCGTNSTISPCEPAAGSQIDQCLCNQGAPPKNCSYLLTAGSAIPLTCAQICKTTFFPG